MVSIASQPTFEPDAAQMRRHVGHLFEGWLDGCHEGRIELAWRDAEDGRLRHAMTFGTDELDELVERAVEENAKLRAERLHRAGTAPAQCRSVSIVAGTKTSSP